MICTRKHRAGEESIMYPEGLHSETRFSAGVIGPLISLTAQTEDHVSRTLSGVIFLDTRKKDKQ